MWDALFDAEGGFWAEYGPTTVERRSTCFNKTEDEAECNWAGPSWPYETSRGEDAHRSIVAPLDAPEGTGGLRAVVEDGAPPALPAASVRTGALALCAVRCALWFLC